MSGLRTIDLREVEALVDFMQGPGYVLDFSNATFAQFFASELSVDIDGPTYADTGGSKGKRLKRFLQKVDDRTALKALNAIWDYRVTLLQRVETADPVKNAEARYTALVKRLGGKPDEAQGPQEAPKPAFDSAKIDALSSEIIALSSLDPQARGYRFEEFLTAMFNAYGLRPREPFRNRGEQIDGSFVLAHETYLLEAKWQAGQVGAADLHAFQGKLTEKATWARGLFVSYSGFTEDGLHAFGKGKSVVCMDGLDISDMLSRRLPLDHVLNRKVRRAAETGAPFFRVRDLFH